AWPPSVKVSTSRRPRASVNAKASTAEASAEAASASKRRLTVRSSYCDSAVVGPPLGHPPPERKQHQVGPEVALQAKTSDARARQHPATDPQRGARLDARLGGVL